MHSLLSEVLALRINLTTCALKIGKALYEAFLPSSSVPVVLIVAVIVLVFVSLLLSGSMYHARAVCPSVVVT